MGVSSGGHVSGVARRRRLLRKVRSRLKSSNASAAATLTLNSSIAVKLIVAVAVVAVAFLATTTTRVGGTSLAANRLVEDLLSTNNKYVRPVRRYNESLLVNFGMKLTQLLEMNLKNQVMAINVWVIQQWFDYKLTWDPREYGNVTEINLPAKQIWIPDIVLYNSADGFVSVTLNIMTKALVRFDGFVEWRAPAIFRSSCRIDIEYFPFDTQACTLKFGSWSHDGLQVNLAHISQRDMNLTFFEKATDLTEYYRNVEWDLMEASATRNLQFYECCPGMFFPDVTFKFVFRRKPLFYTVNLILPCVGITVLSLLVFYLPSDSGEKVTLTIFTLVSLIFFLSVLFETMPSTSLKMPLLGKYLCCTLILITISVCATVFVLNVHFRTPSTHTLSPLIRKWAIEILPKYLLLNAPQLHCQQHAQQQLAIAATAATASSIVFAATTSDVNRHQLIYNDTPTQLFADYNNAPPAAQSMRKSRSSCNLLHAAHLNASSTSSGGGGGGGNPQSLTRGHAQQLEFTSPLLPYLQSEAARRLLMQRSRSSERDKSSRADATEPASGAPAAANTNQTPSNDCDSRKQQAKFVAAAAAKLPPHHSTKPQLNSRRHSKSGASSKHKEASTKRAKHKRRRRSKKRRRLFSFFRSSNRNSDLSSSPSSSATSSKSASPSLTSDLALRRQQQQQQQPPPLSALAQRLQKERLQQFAAPESSCEQAVFDDNENEQNLRRFRLTSNAAAARKQRTTVCDSNNHHHHHDEASNDDDSSSSSIDEIDYEYHSNFQKRASVCNINPWRIGPARRCSTTQQQAPSGATSFYRPVVAVHAPGAYYHQPALTVLSPATLASVQQQLAASRQVASNTQQQQQQQYSAFRRSATLQSNNAQQQQRPQVLSAQQLLPLAVSRQQLGASSYNNSNNGVAAMLQSRQQQQRQTACVPNNNNNNNNNNCFHHPPTLHSIGRQNDLLANQCSTFASASYVGGGGQSRSALANTSSAGMVQPTTSDCELSGMARSRSATSRLNLQAAAAVAAANDSYFNCNNQWQTAQLPFNNSAAACQASFNRGEPCLLNTTNQQQQQQQSAAIWSTTTTTNRGHMQHEMQQLARSKSNMSLGRAAALYATSSRQAWVEAKRRLNDIKQQQDMLAAAKLAAATPLSSEIDKAIQNAMFIAQHIDNLDEFESVKENWKYIAMVIDRIFLIAFGFACIVISVWIFALAPTLYDKTKPLDSQLVRQMLNSTGLPSDSDLLSLTPDCGM